MVLNENQRKAKRRLIKENRDKRHREEMLRQTGLMLTNRLTDGEEGLINAIVIAHRETSHLARKRSSSSSGDEASTFFLVSSVVSSKNAVTASINTSIKRAISGQSTPIVKVVLA